MHKDRKQSREGSRITNALVSLDGHSQGLGLQGWRWQAVWMEAARAHRALSIAPSVLMAAQGLACCLCRGRCVWARMADQSPDLARVGSWADGRSACSLRASSPPMAGDLCVRPHRQGAASVRCLGRHENQVSYQCHGSWWNRTVLIEILCHSMDSLSRGLFPSRAHTVLSPLPPLPWL